MASSRRQYPFHLIEPKWQKIWDEQQAFRAFNPGELVPENHPFAKRHGADSMVAGGKSQPKFYILDMFPYPSGAGLHVGHPEGYTATDILARYRRACGFNVLHPMGWDAFGLPAEQYAVKTGQHPRVTTEASIANFKRQIKSLGFSYDWTRELATTDPDYFKWTQWIFLKLYNSWFNPETNKAEPIETLKYPEELKLSEDKVGRVTPCAPGPVATERRARSDAPYPADLESARRSYRDSKRLAYVSEQPVWWCEQLGTVLANEEVVDGKSEVGGFPVIRKPMRQWMLRITAYAEKLLADLDTIEWSDSLKEMQRNWIGRSEGAEVDFQVAGSSEIIRVFTTRPDTLFGATYMVLCPEHRLVDQITPASWPDGVPVEWTKGRPATQTASTNHAKEIAAKAAHFGAEVVDLNKLDIPIEVVAQIPSYLARKHGVIPVNVAAANLTVAVSDPSDLTTIDVLCRSLKRDLTIVVAAPSAIEVALQKYYRPSPKEVIAEYRAYAAGKSDLERTELAKEKTGVFTGAYAINPVNGEKIPIWIADYVLASYGTGAIMAVPAHDKRDFEFARQFKLPIRSVVARLEPSRLLGGDPKATFHMIVLPVGEAGKVAYVSQDVCDEGEGYAVNSTNPEISISGLPTAEAKKKITDWLEAKGLGEKTVNFKLRDWLFSRQRYWGEPFPIVWKRDANGDLYHEALPESALPLLPPALDDYKPTPDGQPPLARAKDWVALPDGSTRETNTMPQWAGSCWYYLRYLDAKNSKTFVGKAAENYWMGVSGHSTPNYQPSIKSTPGVDLYVGGTEHAVLHLLYARFWHKVLFDLGYVSTPEPFFKLVNQGLILGEDGQKMAKSRGNVVNPDDMVAGFGADAFRLYEMFMGPLQDTKPWNTKGVEGVYRFLGRVWRLFVDEQSETEFEQAETVANTQAPQTPQLLELIKLNPTIKDTPPQPAQLKTLHACVKKVTDDLDGLRFNTAISAMMVFINETMTWETKPVSVLREFLILLQPFAPHLAEELWAKLSSAFSLQPSALPYAPWPTHDPALLAEDTLKIAVQINGRLRDVIRVPANADNATLEAAAKASAKVKPFLDGKTIKKVIVVPKKLVNIVVA